MKKVHCIIVDDEYNARDVIKRYIERISWLELKSEFKDPIKAIEYIGREYVGLIFLDINMPSMTGVDFVKMLSKKPEIIFTTAYSHYAMDGYENDVVDYLLKPIRFERFLKAVSKIDRKNDLKAEVPEYIMVRSGHGLHQLNLADILYLKKDSNYIEIHLMRERKVLIRENMNKVFSIFPEQYFVRVHKSYVISKNSIWLIESHQITLSNGKKIPLGASYREDLMNSFSVK